MANSASRIEAGGFRRGFTVVSLRGLGAVEGARAEGSGSWAGSEVEEVMANAMKKNMRAVFVEFGRVCTVDPPYATGRVPRGEKYTAIVQRGAT